MDLDCRSLEAIQADGFVPNIEVWRRLAVGLDADPIVHGVSKTLLAAKIPLGRLDGDVAQQELDLVQFASGIAAQAGALLNDSRVRSNTRR
jgi:hypothetical protein